MEILIKKAQKGDEEAFIQALTSYMPVMYKVARTRLSSEEDVGDAIQETILSSFKNLQSLKNPSYFRTWLIKILINKCNDIIKQNSKVICIGSYEETDMLTDAVSNGNLEGDMDFNRILLGLSIDYRTVIVLYYVNGFNTREISEILNEKEGTIKSRLSRARAQLKSSYTGLLEVK
ncbi:sigma-70 family RNA polymerase sigma factor [Desulfosporosinus sp. OT]|uniref:RNA polymerase sigma factor n=1 Tax=Desulfosporosinus sp. OT TaxID=913865 RepID=UPI000223ACF8|nr:sigma-70 family RNA polymerase sigma factor [Desulfosporosinus sp. OT]EGW41778.1 RNA polymerase sigma factor, sigma-70 family protein [Desulfosporosinus sp. OT]